MPTTFGSALGGLAVVGAGAVVTTTGLLGTLVHGFGHPPGTLPMLAGMLAWLVVFVGVGVVAARLRHRVALIAVLVVGGLLAADAGLTVSLLSHPSMVDAPLGHLPMWFPASLLMLTGPELGDSQGMPVAFVIEELGWGTAQLLVGVAAYVFGYLYVQLRAPAPAAKRQAEPLGV